jgi:hypothetical protein
MTVLGNIDGVVNTLTDARIKQARAIMQQAEDRLRFHDQRVQQYAGKINVAREQRGERFDKELALVFAQFGLNPPDVESMMEPSMTNLVQLHAQKRKSYVGSRLLTGVSTVHEDETGGYVEFVDGQRVDLPGADEGYTVYVHRLTPYVIVIHINKFTAEYLKSLGYKTSKGPFDCCKTPFGCIIQ